MRVVLSREDVLCLSKWIVEINLIAAELRLIWPPSLVGDTIGFEAIVSISVPSIYLSFLRAIALTMPVLVFIWSCLHNYGCG